jgi:predicted nucleotidyltransferase
MQKKEIEMYFAQLGKELQILEVQRPVRILLIGGAFMLIQVKNRQTTDDIDILLKDGEDATAPVLSQTFKAAIRAVQGFSKYPKVPKECKRSHSELS